MSETFEVGQKVRYGRGGDGVVTYGPYKSTFGDDAYLVKRDDGVERTWFGRHMSVVPEPPKFAVGDVTSNLAGSRRYTIAGGPFADGRHEWYAATNPEGQTHKIFASDLSEIVRPEPIKVGDRVRVTDDDCGGFRFGGRVGVVKRLSERSPLPYYVQFGDGRGNHGDDNGYWNCRAVERVEDENTYTHDGVTYDLSARYVDDEGDYWTFAYVGDTVRGNCATENIATDVHEWCSSLADAVRRYGPLTRITD